MTDNMITNEMGGELIDMVDKLDGKEFECTCGHSQCLGQETDWKGYPHEGGLRDKMGTKWWLYIECPECEYQWAWHKIESRLTKTEKKPIIATMGGFSEIVLP